MYKPKHKLWIANNHIVIDTRWFVDAREEARKQLGLPTYDSIEVTPAPAQYAPPPKSTVHVVDYKGSAMNRTLELCTTDVRA